MSERFKTDNPELEALFERYRSAPESYVFAPLADGCRKAGLLEEAIEICEKGVSRHPGYASGYVVRGKCYYDLGNADQAEASFEKVLELDGNNLVALKYMGMILIERGQEREARAHFEHILALDPDDREIAAKLAELGLEDTSIEGNLARELNEVLGDDPVPGGERATVESRSGGAGPIELRDIEDETFVGAEITLGDGEQTPDVLATMTLADIYAAQGYRKKAIKIYSELLESQPGNQAVADRLRELGVEASADSGETVPMAEPVISQEPDHPAGTGGPAATSATSAGKEAAVGTGPDGAPLDPRSATHFKRWLENFSR